MLGKNTSSISLLVLLFDAILHDYMIIPKHLFSERLLAAQNPLTQTDRPHQLFADAPPIPQSGIDMHQQMHALPIPPGQGSSKHYINHFYLVRYYIPKLINQNFIFSMVI